MEKLELTFPAFYHGAIKGACPLQQYNCVNLLLRGRVKFEDSMGISEATASVYVNGVKPLPKDLIYELLHLPSHEIIRRLKELNIFDISLIVKSVVKLLEVTSLSLSVRKELLEILDTPDQEYHFLCAVFWCALKNPIGTTRLTKRERDLIKSCRINSTSREKNASAPEDPQIQESEPAGVATDQPDGFGYDRELVDAPAAGQFKTVLSVQKWAAQMPAEWQDIYDFSARNVVDQSDFISIDTADLKEILPAPDNIASVLLLKCEGIFEKIVGYIEKSRDFDGAVSALFFLSGQFEPLSLDSLNTVANKIQGHCSPDATIIFGCKLNEKISSDCICLYILASLPESYIANTRDKAGQGDASDLQGVQESDENDQFPLNLF